MLTHNPGDSATRFFRKLAITDVRSRLPEEGQRHFTIGEARLFSLDAYYSRLADDLDCPHQGK
jgi:hypothetical protein